MFIILLGIIQGLTEFLPISSSAHFLFFFDLANLKDVLSDVYLNVALHAGTFLALVIYFYKDLILYIKGFIQSFTQKEKTETRLMGWYLIIGTLPAALGGFFWEEKISALFYNLGSVAWWLFIGALLFLWVENKSSQQPAFSTLTLKKALFIGCMQSLVLMPGVSRSGITIIAGLFLKLKRETAAKFSFLLGLPVMAGAIVKELATINLVYLSGQVKINLVLAVLASFITGYIAIKYLLDYVKNHSFAVFAYYRIIFAFVIVLYLSIKAIF